MSPLLGLERVMGFAIARHLFGERWSVHALVVKEPVDTEGAEHHTQEARQLEAHRVAEGLSATVAVLSPELILGMKLKSRIQC